MTISTSLDENISIVAISASITEGGGVDVVDRIGEQQGHRRALARQPAAARAVERQAAHMALLLHNPLHRCKRRAEVLQPRLIPRHNRALRARDPTREVMPA